MDRKKVMKTMTKKKKNSVSAPKQKPPTSEMGIVEFPVFDIPNAFCLRRVQVFLNPDQRKGLRRLFDGLQVEGETLKNGKPIVHPIDGVRWMLEKVSEA